MSSALVLQVGQGGNQYGFAFFDAMANGGMSSQFFQEQERDEVGKARAILIDMEPKVVAAVTKKAGAGSKWRYNPGHRFTLESGSGNNWAAGYCNGAAWHEALMEQVRVEVEACDCFGGFMGIQSLAGGTGAGFGAYILEAVRDEYPSSCILSHCIWPFHSGEVVVQNYNAILTLAKLNEVADGIITVHNEALSSICIKSLGIARPSFSDMNRAGAHSLAAVLLPSRWRPPDAHQPVDESSDDNVRLLSDVAYALCAHPAYRILGLYSTPQVRADSVAFTTFTWASQLRQLRRSVYPVQLEQVPGESKLSKSVQKSVASLLVLRGQGSGNADVSSMADPSLYPVWSVDPLHVAAAEETPSMSKRSSSSPLVAGMLTNCQSAILPAADLLARAYSMYFSRAYLHQYLQHGLDQSTFDAAFATVEDVLLAYKSLSKP